MPRPMCTLCFMVVYLPASSGCVDCAVSNLAKLTREGPRTQLYSITKPSWAPVNAWKTAASNWGPRKSWPVWKSNFYGAFVLNRDFMPSTRRDFVKNYRAPDTR